MVQISDGIFDILQYTEGLYHQNGSWKRFCRRVIIKTEENRRGVKLNIQAYTMTNINLCICMPSSKRQNLKAPLFCWKLGTHYKLHIYLDCWDCDILVLSIGILLFV
jgi:hypothetical protein